MAGDAAPLIPFVIFMFAVVVLLVVAQIMAGYGKLWFQAYISSTNISFVDLLGMTFRKVKPRVIVTAKIMAAQAGLEIDDAPMSLNDAAISTRKLEEHYLAGGDVTKVIKAMITAKRENTDLGFREACEIDLSGRDVEEPRRPVDSNDQR